ncbi:hypothetical protein AWL63_18285 [Sphingomonas panacis]|uniref:TonB-dependent receptor-like beta-barrel domain-containing protein n=1 Tax=Sphingomonas panacis TaxID=1560345 RepID=A0A1B3ZDU5_9SPHN|nr:hypothetical protein AWL63_18285 [Sphingomonas panacis]
MTEAKVALDELSDTAIVVTGRRLTPIDDIKPRRILSDDTLSAYRTTTLGELLEAIAQHEGVAPDVVVNGRRLGSLADIEALPPEAVERVEIYDAPVGQRFGFAPRGGRTLNIVLKRNFQSLTVEAKAGGTTRRDRGLVSMVGRGARLRGDRRLNATVSAVRDGEVRASRRPAVGGNSETGVQGNRDRSLVPGRKELDARLGFSLPLGNGMLDMGVKTNHDRTFSLLALSDVSGVLLPAQRRRQLTSVDAQDISATYSVNRGAWFTSIMIGLSHSVSHSITRLQQDASTALCTDVGPVCRSQSVALSTTTGSVDAQLGGPLLDLTPGQVRLDIHAGHDRSSVVNFDRLYATRPTYRYRSTRAQVTLTLPLVGPKTPLLGVLGTIDFSPTLTIESLAGTGRMFGRALSASWLIFPELSVNAVMESRGSFPSIAQLGAPRLVVPDVNVYDYRVAGIVATNYLTGGTALARESSDTITLSANYTRTFGGMSAAFGTTYLTIRTNEPIVSLPEPSPLLEAYFPDHFIRDAGGRLTLIDARPFNARRLLRKSLTLTLNLAGTSDASSTAGPKATVVRPLQWRLGVRAEHLMEQSLQLMPRFAPIDLLAHPLSIVGGAPSAWNLTLQGGVTGARTSLVVDYSWRSGVHAQAQNGHDAIHSEPLGMLDFTASRDFGNAGNTQSTPTFRVTGRIRNILDARPNITVFSRAGASRLNPWLLAPEGRSILISLTVPIGKEYPP